MMITQHKYKQEILNLLGPKLDYGLWNPALGNPKFTG